MESKCYDMAGMNYYHMGDTELALYFHNRYMNDKYEAPNTPLRMVGETQIVLKQIIKDNQ